MKMEVVRPSAIGAAIYKSVLEQDAEGIYQMKLFAILPVISLVLMFGACSTDDSTPETQNDKEYLIISRSPSNEQDNKYFQAIDIHTKQISPILGIVETTGRKYLPIMSSFPECNKKVIQGYVSLDTLFITTKIVRDTTVPTVGI